MSDKIYACLIRLYPSRFRKEYSKEALQLFRDRFRDESGFLRRIRLWCDLLIDLATGLPLAWRNSCQEQRAAAVSPVTIARPFRAVASPSGSPASRHISRAS